MSLYDLSLQLKSLNKQKKFEETLQFFKTNKAVFGVDEIGKNKYVVYEVLLACIALNHYEAVFVFMERYGVQLETSNLFYLLKHAKNKQNINWNFILRMCNLVSVEQLSTACTSKIISVKGRDKHQEFSSEKENWYALKTKALFELGQYENCCLFSIMALADIEQFHYANDVWFARRIALSKKKLGNNTEALQELFKVLKRKKEWFIQYEIAQIYFEIGLLEEAFNYSIDALSNFGDIAYKVGLIEFFASVLEQKNEKELTWKHLQLSKVLREQAEWNLPLNLQNQLAKYEHEFESDFTLTSLLNELKNYWKKLKPVVLKKEKETDEMYGKILSLLHNNEQGTDGFIAFKQEKLYFRIGPEHYFSKKVKTGMPVVFKMMPANAKHKRKRALITRLDEILQPR